MRQTSTMIFLFALGLALGSKFTSFAGIGTAAARPGSDRCELVDGVWGSDRGDGASCSERPRREFDKCASELFHIRHELGHCTSELAIRDNELRRCQSRSPDKDKSPDKGK